VVNRDEKRGRGLVDLLNEKTKISAELVPWRGPYSVPSEADIVVNATSIGLYPDLDARLALNFDSLRPSMVVADVIVNPPTTHFTREAGVRGCKALSGLGMVVNQGVIGIKYWTGVDVDAGVMRRTVEELMRS